MLNNRYEFVYLFDVINGNPNGDPDANNLPRLDPETGRGLVTDVCLKRKIRDYVALQKSDSSGVPEPGYQIYMQEKAVLNNQHKKAWAALELPLDKNITYKTGAKSRDTARELTAWMCQNFFDIRTFGAVMSTGVNCGQVRGPIQMAFAHSIDPITPMEVAITRVAVTNEKDVNKGRVLGRRYIVPYALYRCHGFISAHLAQQTGFSEQDLALFFQALQNMFEYDRSAARGEMSSRGLYVFKHDSTLGNVHANQLFDKIKITPKTNQNTPQPIRDFSDYTVTIDPTIPPSVELRPGG